MEQKENFKTVVKDYWEKSNFWRSLIKNIALLVVFLYKMVRVLVLKIKAKIVKYPIPFLIGCVTILILTNIYTFVKWKVGEKNEDQTAYIIKTKIDSARINAYSDGYEDGKKIKPIVIPKVEEEKPIPKKIFRKKDKIGSEEKKDSV